MSDYTTLFFIGKDRGSRSSKVKIGVPMVISPPTLTINRGCGIASLRVRKAFSYLNTVHTCGENLEESRDHSDPIKIL